MTPTEFHVEVVRVGPVNKHPNADTLELTEVNGYPVVTKSGTFKEGDNAVYVPVDALVPTDRSEFAFLAKSGLPGEQHRIRAVRLRGIFSMGLLVPLTKEVRAEVESGCGKSLREALGIEKYIPPSERNLEQATKAKGASKAQAAPGWMPVYGIEAYRRNKGALIEGEEVVLTEKIHGCNARYCYANGRLYVGSHKSFRGTSPTKWAQWLTSTKLRIQDFFGRKHRADLIRDHGDVWWQAAKDYSLEAKLKQIPNHIVYGEIYGKGVQDLEYGLDHRKFVVFDILDVNAGRYLDFDEMESMSNYLGLHTAPTFYRGPWQSDLVSLAEGKSHLAPLQIREGFVARPVVERRSHMGRVILKVVGEGYLLRKTA